MQRLGTDENLCIQKLISFSSPTKSDSIAGAQDICLVLEYYPEGSLHDLIGRMYEKKEKFLELECLEIFLGICKAVNILHSQNPPLAHRDVKVLHIPRIFYRN